MSGLHACLLEVMSIKPTSQERGKGLVSRWLGVVEGNQCYKSEGGGSGMGGGPMNINGDGVDVILKLRWPS